MGLQMELAVTSREQFRNAFEHACIGLLLSDTKGVCLEVNRALCKLLGFKREELIGTTLHEMTHREDITSNVTCMKQLRSGVQDACTYEKRYINKLGRTIWARVDLLLIRDTRDHPMYFLAQVQDISIQKQAAAQLKDYQERLESLAFQLALTETRERRRVAAALHDNISQILALARIQLINLEPHVQPAGRHALKNIRSQLEACLSFSRNLTFELSPPVLYDTGLEAAVQSLGKRFEAGYGVRFWYESDGRPKPLKDEKRILLFQAVRELLVNVVKHARADQTWVTIRRVWNNIEICVRDNGPGTGGPPEKATSFGLFNIRRRLKCIGGGLKAESGPGRGTQIILCAPLDTNIAHNPPEGAT